MNRKHNGFQIGTRLHLNRKWERVQIWEGSTPYHSDLMIAFSTGARAARNTL